MIIAETGGDMTAFPTPAHLAAWAGVCPGQHACAGQKKNVAAPRPTHGYAAPSAKPPPQAPAPTPTSAPATWHMITTNQTRNDLGEDHYPRHHNPDRRRHRLITQLEHLGYTVTLKPQPNPA